MLQQIDCKRRKNHSLFDLLLRKFNIKHVQSDNLAQQRLIYKNANTRMSMARETKSCNAVVCLFTEVIKASG